MITETRLDKTKFVIVKKGQEIDDIFYWLERLPIERIIALEMIRNEYNTWKYGTERGFQRVYQVVKRQWS
ncbi:MAG: hypothetical protein MUE81_00090 [Thermoflexibacter sp.]|jgi:hypothetical protein|nr:hypothetical protein [Thermoflexibacter sp.]